MKKILTFCSAFALFIVLMTCTRVTAADTTQIGYDQNPAGGYIHQTLSFSGWAADTVGVGSVLVNIDSDPKFGWKSATLAAHADTAGFPAGNTVAFSFSADVQSLSTGPHTVGVAVLDKDGKVKTISTFPITKAAPVTHIDAPASKERFSRYQSITVSGWAVNATGIWYDCMSVDGKPLSGSGNPWNMMASGGSTPTLSNTYHGAYLNEGIAGCSYTIQPGTLSPGTHTITVAGVGNDGTISMATTAIDVYDPSSKVTVDQSLNGTFLHDQLSFTGTALDPSGVSYVCVNYDGRPQWKFAAVKTSTPSPAGYPDGSAVTYSFQDDVKNFSDGVHTIGVAVVGKDGGTTVTTFQVRKASPVICVDDPADNAVTGYGVTIQGWALNATGVWYDCVSVDGKPVNSSGNIWSLAASGEPSPGLNAAYQGAYKDADSNRFSFTIPQQMLTDGPHTITVASVGNDGRVVTATKKITVRGPAPIMGIFQSLDNTYLHDTLSFTGCAANCSGIRYVCMDIDSDLKWRLISTGPTNPLGGYPSDSTAAINANINVAGLAPGSHVFRVAAVGYDGQTTYAYFHMTKAAPKMALVSPNGGSIVSNSGVSIFGYALNATGIKYGCVDVDGTGWQLDGFKTVPLNFDLNSQTGGAYKDANASGFTLTIPSLSLGQHTITVAITGNDNQQTYQQVVVAVKGKVTYRYYNSSRSGYSPDPESLARNGSDVYQFMTLNYLDNVNAAALDSLLYSRSNSIFTYLRDVKHEDVGALFIQAGKLAGVNPIYLVAHSCEETGFGTSGQSNGEAVGSSDTFYGSPVSLVPGTYYNFFGINTHDERPFDGIVYAALHDWSTPDKAIIGGAQWIADKYVYGSYQQETLYDMLFNPLVPGVHSYCTDDTWAHQIAGYIQNYFDVAGGSPIPSIEIPVYAN